MRLPASTLFEGGVNRRGADMEKRGTPPPLHNNGNAGQVAGVISVVTLVLGATAAFIAWIYLKKLRRRNAAPKYLPGKFLKRRWEAWMPSGLWSAKESRYSARLQDLDSDVPTLHSRSARQSTLEIVDPERQQADVQGQSGQAEAGVDRQTSVRSVMTLPAYSHSVRASERVLGREGERDGIDVVIEAPETLEEEEERRDEEMEALYQIRVQRRTEVADRDERRNQRRLARERQDFERLRQLRLESAQAAETREATGAAAMIADHQGRSRDRRVSSVSYGDLGVARHDGTRLRANSNDSDRPLLDSAADISGASNTTRPWQHRRETSTSSFRSGHSDATATTTDLDLPPFGRAGSDFEAVSLTATYTNQSRPRSNTGSSQLSLTPTQQRSRASSRLAQRPPSIDTSNTSADLGESRIPEMEPPTYHETAPGGYEENAPPYTSPVSERQLQKNVVMSPSGAPLLPEIGRLPSIRVAGATPVDGGMGFMGGFMGGSTTRE